MGITLYECEAYALLYTNVKNGVVTLYDCEAWALLYTNVKNGGRLLYTTVKHGYYFIGM